jgi:hypothetical protein
MNRLPCESEYECTECSPSEASVAYEVVYDHLNKIQLEKSGIASLNAIIAEPDFNHYIEYKISLQSDYPYYFGFYLDRSPPFTYA